MYSEIQKLVSSLDLEPHPEGGFYKRIFISNQSLKLDGKTVEANERPLTTAIIYLLHASDFSCLHRIASEELWTLGSANTSIKLSILGNAGFEETLLSANQPFYTVKPHTWFAAELVDKSDDHYALAYCVVSPGFDFADLDMATMADIETSFPEDFEQIRHLCKS